MKTFKNKIIIIGDSNSMPRLEVEYEDSYIYMLKQYYENTDIIDKCRRGGTTDRFVNEGSGFKDAVKGADILEYYKPSIVITQLGIVDCAPRLVRPKSLLSYTLKVSPGFVKDRIYFLLKKYKKRSLNNSDVNPEQFRANWVNFLDRASAINAKVIAINITHPTRKFIEKNADIGVAITTYNEIVASLQDKYDNLIAFDPFDYDEVNKFVLDDGYHYNKAAHGHLFSKLQNLIGGI